MVRVFCPRCHKAHCLDNKMIGPVFTCSDCGCRVRVPSGKTKLARTSDTSGQTVAADKNKLPPARQEQPTPPKPSLAVDDWLEDVALANATAATGANKNKRPLLSSLSAASDGTGPSAKLFLGVGLANWMHFGVIAALFGIVVFLLVDRGKPNVVYNPPPVQHVEDQHAFNPHAAPIQVAPEQRLAPLRPVQPIPEIIVPPPEAPPQLDWSAYDLWRAYHHDPDGVTRRLEGRRITVFGVSCVDCVPSPFPNQIEELMGNRSGVIFRRERDRDLDGVEVDIVSQAWDNSVNHRGQTAKFRGTFFPQVSFRLRQFNPAEKKRPFLTEAVPVP